MVISPTSAFTHKSMVITNKIMAGILLCFTRTMEFIVRSTTHCSATLGWPLFGGLVIMCCVTFGRLIYGCIKHNYTAILLINRSYWRLCTKTASCFVLTFLYK